MKMFFLFELESFFVSKSQVQNRPEFGTGSREHKTERIEYEYKNKAPNLGLSATMG